MWPCASSIGTVSVNVSLPPRRITSVTGSSCARILGVLRDAAVVAELLLDRGLAPQVADHQLQAGHDERRLAGAAEQALELERRVLGEDLAVRPELDPGAGAPLPTRLPLRVRPDFCGERRLGAVTLEDAGHAAVEAQPLLAGERSTSMSIRAESALTTESADAVQATGGDVRTAAELAAGVQLGRHDLDTGQPGLGLLVGGDAAPVVVHLDRVVGVQRHLDPLRVSRPAPRRRRCR